MKKSSLCALRSNCCSSLRLGTGSSSRWSSLSVVPFAYLIILASVGCFKPAPPQPAASAAPEPAAQVTPEEATPRETIGKTTQNVLELQAALNDGGKPAETSIAPSDPLTQSAAAYRTQVAKIAGITVDQAIQIRNAQSIQDPKPLSYDQFLKEIIRVGQPDGIQLPMLPYYQEYAWDVQQQKLIVVDFPARQEARQRELDAN